DIEAVVEHQEEIPLPGRVERFVARQDGLRHEMAGNLAALGQQRLAQVEESAFLARPGDRYASLEDRAEEVLQRTDRLHGFSLLDRTGEGQSYRDRMACYPLEVGESPLVRDTGAHDGGRAGRRARRRRPMLQSVQLDLDGQAW